MMEMKNKNDKENMEVESILEHPLSICQDKLDNYTKIMSLDISLFPEASHNILKTMKHLCVQSLTSKQCNEPYEELLSDVLDLKNNDKKHGWDAFSKDAECEQDANELYEYKPSKAFNPCGTINDDSVAKIEKYEKAFESGKKIWMVLAKVNTDNYTIDSIYKFPAEIYSQDRREYLKKLIERNKLKSKQTRATYNITVKKSIQLCRKLCKSYFIWKRPIL